MKRASQPDTPADVRLRECITEPERKSFVVVAGAGSGKTTSLIKALASIVEVHGASLARRRQKVACITYTDIAAGEIWADVGQNPLVHVSTIHSFLWSVARSFQSDIRAWVDRRIRQKLNELRETAANYGPRVQQRTKEKNVRDIARYEEELTYIAKVPAFVYGTGSNYAKGVLGHDDVLRMTSELLMERPLFRTLLGQQFPFVFVDESQDTTKSVVDALKAVQAQLGNRFCLGFFGDPMQRIYPTGVGPIPLEQDWVQIDKPENFRCPTTVLAVANAIRRDGDALVQTGGRTELVNGEPTPVTGSARIFVLPADAKRDERIDLVRTWVAARQNDEAWQSGDGADVKLLVVVHRMAATRLGFGDVYSALNDRAPSAFSDNFLDASAWPLRPFMSFVLPLSDAIRGGREFDAITILRRETPAFAKGATKGANVAQLLKEMRAASTTLTDLMAEGSGASVRDVLTFVQGANLLALDPRFQSHLEGKAPTALEPGEDGAPAEDGEEVSKEVASMDAFLRCPAEQLRSFRAYTSDLSPFSTQQGIKGAEFPRVLVVLDDEEGSGHTQFSYEKYFGIKPPSAGDLSNLADGKETAVHRTRRLFYVCCTRALTDLIVVMFSPDAAAAEERIRASGIFPPDAIHGLQELGA